jgi:hypothetical protein
VKFLIPSLFALTATFSVPGSAQIAKEAYKATVDTALCKAMNSTQYDCTSPYKWKLDVTVQMDQLESSVILEPKVEVKQTGDVDLPSQMVYECVYTYSAKVARATVEVKNSKGGMISSSISDVLAQYTISSGTVPTFDSKCPDQPQDKVEPTLTANPVLTTEFKGQPGVVLDLALDPMSVDGKSKAFDSATGAFKFSDLSISPTNGFVWSFYPKGAVESGRYLTRLSRGRVKF